VSFIANSKRDLQSFQINRVFLLGRGILTNSGSKNSSNFKEFEKNTYNDWILSCDESVDETDDDGDLNNRLLLISLEESNEMAQRIIKDHKDKQKQKETQSKH
jgi:hypothetical protein